MRYHELRPVMGQRHNISLTVNVLPQSLTAILIIGGRAFKYPGAFTDT